jgi:SGNH hydrolase-like domain, acetyltransferase AlgX
MSVTARLLCGSAVVVLASVLAAFGVFDSFASDGELDRTLIGSLIAYWVLLGFGVLLFAAIREGWKESLLFLSVVALMLVSAEIVARYLFPFRSMPRLHGVSSESVHHIYPANRTMYAGEYEDKHVVVSTNEHGLRTQYSPEAFRAHPKRIMVLGDSFVFGLGVPQESTFPEVLERNLSRTLPGLAVLNAGVISHSPLLSKLLLDEIDELYLPTLVVLVLDPTDIGDDIQYAREIKRDGDNRVYFETRRAQGEPYYGGLVQVLSPYLALPYRKLIDAIGFGDPYDYYRFELTIGDVTERNRYFIYRHPLELTERYFTETASHVRDAAAIANSVGASFLLVVSPRFHHWNTKEAPDNWEKDEYSLNEPFQYEYSRFFDEAQGRLGFPVLNLLPSFQATEEFPLVFRDDPHWNERGHAFVAEAIAEHLTRLQLLE